MARFDGNQTKMGAALGVSQATVSNFLNGRAGAGRTLATALATELGVPHDALVSESLGDGGSGSVRFGDLPGWAEATQEVLTGRSYKGRLPELAVLRAGEFRGMTTPTIIDARTVFNYAKAWWEGLSDTEQSAAIQAQAEAEMAIEDREASDLLRRGALRDELQNLDKGRGH